MRKPLLITLVALSSACAPRPGTVRTGDAENPLVAIEAGTLGDPSGDFRARYLVDRATQTCWLMSSGALAPLDCCAARRVPAVAQFVTWEDAASCTQPPGP